MVLAQAIIWSSLGFPALYRCQDPGGTMVLTDNPAQLKECSRLDTSTPSSQDPQKTVRSQTDDQTSLSPQDSDDSSLSLETPIHEKASPGSGQKDIIIPLSRIGGSFVVEATLNEERTAQLIVDTGASMTVLSTDIALDLGIFGTTDDEILTVHTAGGSVQVNKNYLSSLEVGNAHAQNIAVAIHDLPDISEQIEGLLGMSFLKHFIITLDAEHRRLILRPKQHS